MEVSRRQVDERGKNDPNELFGPAAGNILRLVSRYGEWDKVTQYAYPLNPLQTTQALIDEGYIQCSPDGNELWLTERAKNELTF